MRLLKTALIGIGLLSLVALPACAQEASLHHTSGIVLAVDAKGRLAVEEAGKEATRQSFEVAARADIKKGDKRITVADIKVGDPVSVEYESTMDGNRAVSVRVLTSPGMKQG